MFLFKHNIFEHFCAKKPDSSGVNHSENHCFQVSTRLWPDGESGLVSHSVTTRLQYPGLLLICDGLYFVNLRGRKVANLRTSYHNHH